ncbi:hypothetical protein ACKN8S_05195 [Limosilactobacillus reuteri]|uniref:hypothetical protein n=1 Tax=Limosilactobacillus reuteri TaxID=1598 RepID=UPI0039BEFD93
MVNKNINLFTVAGVEVTPLTGKPILYISGDEINFSLKLLLVLSPSGDLEVAKRYGKTGPFAIISKIIYKDNDQIKILQAYETDMPNERKDTPGIYEIKNDFNIDSKEIPAKTYMNGGEFLLNLTWVSLDNDTCYGDILECALPIYERSNG